MLNTNPVDVKSIILFLCSDVCGCSINSATISLPAHLINHCPVLTYLNQNQSNFQPLEYRLPIYTRPQWPMANVECQQLDMRKKELRILGDA